jgi:hypothetical protein
MVSIDDTSDQARGILRAMQAANSDNHYRTLGASIDATQEEIDRLYKRLARDHHPDRGGDEERMKSINEAYRVLGNPNARGAYDADRGISHETFAAVAHAPIYSTPSAQVDALTGRILGAWLCTLCGLVLLFLVRFHYVRFLWPLALLAVIIVLLGVLMAHGALSFARRSAGPRNLLRRFIWAQEFVFWASVCAGVYGVYRIMAEF